MNLQAWGYLAIAIVAEVIATAALRATEVFTRPVPSAIVVVGYGVAFYFLAHALETVPVGVAYAIWSGTGIVLITAIAWLAFGQALDLAAVVGLVLIIAGVVVLNLFSKTVSH